MKAAVKLTGQEGEAEGLRGMNFTKDTRLWMVLSGFERRSIRVSHPHSLPFNPELQNPESNYSFYLQTRNRMWREWGGGGIKHP